MPPIASTKEILDGLFDRVHRSVVVLISSDSTNGDAVDFGTGSVIFSDTEKVLISIETSLIKKDETISVRFYDGSHPKARVFMQKTAFRHAVLEVKSRLQPTPVRFSESEVTRQDIFTVAAVHMKGAPGLMTGTVGNPNCKAIDRSGEIIYRSESTFAMSCPAAGPAIIPKEEGIIKEPAEIAQLIGAAVFDMDGLVVGTVDTADPYSSKLKFAIKTSFFLDKLEAHLKQKDNEISLLRGKGGLSKGTGTSTYTGSGSSSRKSGRANAPPSGTGTKKTVCIISQVKGNVEVLSQKQQRSHSYTAVRREAFERALVRLVTKESDGAWRSSTSSFARNPGDVDDSEEIIAVEPFELNYFFGGDGKIRGHKSLKLLTWKAGFGS